jgi:DNA-damage-inducible protein J
MITSAKDAVVRARIDPELKEQAARVLEAMGLTVSDVLREVLVRVANDKALPFQVRTSLGAVRDVKIGTITEIAQARPAGLRPRKSGKRDAAARGNADDPFADAAWGCAAVAGGCVCRVRSSV